MWSKEYVDQLRTYCDLNHGIDIGVYASFLEDALDEIEKLQNKVEVLELDLETLGANSLKAMELKDEEIERLREGIESHVARPGEETCECDVNKPCPACRLRQMSEKSRKNIFEFAIKRSNDILRGKK